MDSVETAIYFRNGTNTKLASSSFTKVVIPYSFSLLPLLGQSKNHGFSNVIKYGLRTPNEGINQKYLKNWADAADKIYAPAVPNNLGLGQRYTYRVLQTIQMKLILLCV